jgi:dipeptidyl aminopeptidase/acylaminoacyl peptidase
LSAPRPPLHLPLFLLLLVAPSSGSARPGPEAKPRARLSPPPESITFAPFGRVGIYRRTPHPPHVGLYLSGDGGWNRGEERKVAVLESTGTLVLGIDMRRYLQALAADPRPCAEPARDLEALARAAERQAGYPAYVRPVLLGYSSGATLAYAALVQAEPGVFRAGLGLAFCADFPAAHPLCRGRALAYRRDRHGKGIDFLPDRRLETPFVAFNGAADRVCPQPQVSAYMSRVKGGKLVLLPSVGHGFNAEAKWAGRFRRVYAELVR